MTELLEKAIAAFNALPPDQQRKMLEDTRKSFAENNVALSRPAEPVEGLEVVAYEMLGHLPERVFRTSPLSDNEIQWGVSSVALVTRSQADAIIAAKDDLIDKYKWQVRDTCVRAEKAEADNAAKDARIKELSEINANLMGDDEDKPRYTTKRLKHEIACATKALETHLAAARKDRDRAVEWRDHDKDRAERYCKALERISARNGIPMAGSFAAEIARAALDAKP